MGKYVRRVKMNGKICEEGEDEDPSRGQMDDTASCEAGQHGNESHSQHVLKEEEYGGLEDPQVSMMFPDAYKQ
jgi:hypothetical protein